MASFTPMLRHAARRAVVSATPSTYARPAFAAAQRNLHRVPPRQDKPGTYSRTDSDIEIEHPEEHELPSSQPVRKVGGQYVKPTLSSFTLDGNVGLVTGGARGLGLVIAQGMVYSGSDVALVDMNKEEAEKQTKLLIDAFVKENPNAERDRKSVV